jgi:hypothetical protein
VNVEDLARSAAGDLRRSTADVAVDEMLRRVVRTPGQRVRLQVAAAAATVVALALTGYVAARPGRSPSPTTRPSQVVPLAPLCENPAWQAKLDPPYADTSRDCPETTPAGKYASALIGYDEAQPFTFALPDGWEVNPVPGRFPARLDVAGSNGWVFRERGTDVGVSLLISPARTDGTPIGDVASWAVLLGGRYEVEASPVTDTTFAGLAASQVDLRPRPAAGFGGGCPVGPQCLPLLRTQDTTGPVLAGLRPGVTSRLIVTKPGAQVIGYPLVVWVWGLEGDGDGAATGAAVRQLLDTFSFGGIKPFSAR